MTGENAPVPSFGLSSVFDLLNQLRARLSHAGIPFVITSGMAAVHYGVQQTTKDSDWIIPESHIENFRSLLRGLSLEMPPWRVAYRTVFGAPLDAAWLRHGWTSHLAIWPKADAPEGHVDIFSRPPRIHPHAIDHDALGFASRHVLALMKRTDRDKDWPTVFACGDQLMHLGDARCLFHVQGEASIHAALRQCTDGQIHEAARIRPLLRAAQHSPAQLERLLLIERSLWQEVNRQRYRPYQQAWKDFARRWRQEESLAWPLTCGFEEQHAVVLSAARRFDLPENPLADMPKSELVHRAAAKVKNLLAASEAEIASVLPPEEVLLP